MYCRLLFTYETLQHDPDWASSVLCEVLGELVSAERRRLIIKLYSERRRSTHRVLHAHNVHTPLGKPSGCLSERVNALSLEPEVTYATVPVIPGPPTEGTDNSSPSDKGKRRVRVVATQREGPTPSGSNAPDTLRGGCREESHNEMVEFKAQFAARKDRMRRIAEMADSQCKTIDALRHLVRRLRTSEPDRPSEGRENPPHELAKRVLYADRGSTEASAGNAWQQRAQTRLDTFVALLQKRTEEARESMSSHGRHCEERTISTDNRLFQLEREAANTHRESADIHSSRANPNRIWLKAVQQSAERTTDYEPDQPLARREEAPPAQQAPEERLNPAVNESLGQLHDLRSRVEGDRSVLTQDYARGAGSTNLRAMPMSLVWQTTSRGSREASAQEARPSSRAPAANRVARSLSWDSPQDSQSDDALDGEEPIEATNMEDPETGPESDDPHAGDAYDDELEDPQPRDTYVDEYGEDQEEGPYDDEHENSEENPYPEDSDGATWSDGDEEDDVDDEESDRATRSDEDDQDFDPDEPQYDDNGGGQDYDLDDAQYDDGDQDLDPDSSQYDEDDREYEPDDAPYYEDDEEPQSEDSYTDEYDEDPHPTGSDGDTTALDESEPEYLWAIRESNAIPKPLLSKDGDSELRRDMTQDSCQEPQEPRVQGTGNTKLATQHHRTREQPIDAYKQWPAQHAKEARRIPPEPPPLSLCVLAHLLPLCWGGTLSASFESHIYRLTPVS
jgi:hypothetical protein